MTVFCRDVTPLSVAACRNVCVCVCVCMCFGWWGWGHLKFTQGRMNFSLTAKCYGGES